MTTIAFCPPGQKLSAAIALAMHGVDVDEVKDHSWVDDVVVVHHAEGCVFIPPTPAPPPRPVAPYLVPVTARLIPTVFL